MMKRRTFSKEKKLSVLKEVKQSGDLKGTLDKHGIYPSTFYSWQKKYTQMGEQGFRHGMTKDRLREIRRLEKENSILKELMAEKDLKIRMQADIIKKNRPRWEKGSQS
jgi:putative transposase